MDFVFVREVTPDHFGRDKVFCLIECALQFFPPDTDVGKHEARLCEFGAGEDEAPMSFGGCVFARAAFREETVSGAFDGVTVSA